MLLYGNLLKEEFIMKNIIKTFGSMVTCVVGWRAGSWLWDEVLKSKMDDIKDYFSNKRKEKGA